MPIGTSDGEQYKDEGEYHAAVYAPKEEDSSPVTIPRVYIPTSENNAPAGSVGAPGGIVEDTEAKDNAQYVSGFNEPSWGDLGRGLAKTVAGLSDIKMTDILKSVASSVKSAVTLPGDVLSGKVEAGSQQEIERAMDLAGLMVAGPAPVARKMADGTLGSFAGVRSQGMRDPALKAQLAKAQEMEAIAAHPDDIWNQTGFFKGADQRWRYEISDQGMVLREEAFTKTIEPAQAGIMTSMGEIGGREALETVRVKTAGRWLKLPEIMHHPELFKAYPELNRTLVQPLPPTSKSLGMYDPANNVLFLRDDLSPELARSVIAHEMQHGIQKIEGFARGGSAAEFLPAELELAKLQYKAAKDDAYAAIQTALGLRPSEIDQLAKVVELKEAGKTLPSWEPYLKKLEEAGAYRSLANIAKSERLLKEANEEAALKYRRLAGEVEARNVQTRLDYTNKERGVAPPVSSEDVPRFLQQTLSQTDRASASEGTVTNLRRAANDNEKPMNTQPIADAIDKHFKEMVQEPHDAFIKKYDELHALGNKLAEKGGRTEIAVAKYNKLGRELNPDWEDVPFRSKFEEEMAAMRAASDKKADDFLKSK